MEIHSIPGVRCQLLAGLSEHNGGSAPIETQTAAHTLGMDRRKLGRKATPGDAQSPGIGSVKGEAAVLWLLPQRGAEPYDWLWGLKEA